MKIDKFYLGMFFLLALIGFIFLMTKREPEQEMSIVPVNEVTIEPLAPTKVTEPVVQEDVADESGKPWLEMILIVSKVDADGVWCGDNVKILGHTNNTVGDTLYIGF